MRKKQLYKRLGLKNKEEVPEFLLKEFGIGNRQVLTAEKLVDVVIKVFDRLRNEL